MKSSRKVERFDYSKFETDSNWNLEQLSQYEFWGFHPKSGRIHIDTKRYKKACESVGIKDFMPNGLFKERNTVYFVPKKQHRNDYKVNIFRDLIDELKKQWFEEYRPLFAKITSPQDVYECSRLERIATTGDSDDYDDIDVEARMDAIRRISSYKRIQNELYCLFIQKITTEIDRFTLLYMVECGYKGTDFTFNRLRTFTNSILGKSSLNTLKSLDGYNCYTLLHKLNNFLKHNSREAYRNLNHLFPANVRSPKRGTSKEEYQNGMFAGDWIIINENYLDEVFGELVKFFEAYSKAVLGEDIEESKWNYDDYFYTAMGEMKNPWKYLGLDY